MASSKIKKSTDKNSAASIAELHEQDELLQSLLNALERLSNTFGEVQTILSEIGHLSPAEESASVAPTKAKFPPTKPSPMLPTESKKKAMAPTLLEKTEKARSKTSEPVKWSTETPSFLNALNHLPLPELAVKLKSVGAKQNVVTNIVNERKKSNFKPFQSSDDIVDRIKGLAYPSLAKMISRWV